MSTAPQGPGLGSLAQSSREKQLNNARRILLGIGILTIVVNVVFTVLAVGQVHAEVQQLQQQGKIAPNQAQQLEQTSLSLTYLINGVAVFLGIVFVIGGLIVKKYPVPITITSLVLYVGAIAVFALLNPVSLIQGVVVKVIIVVALAKSIQAAIAYQNELNASRAPAVS